MAILSLTVRQNNIIWTGFLFLLGLFKEQKEKRISMPSVLAYFKKSWTFVLGFVLFAVYIYINRGVALGMEAKEFAEISITFNSIYYFFFTNFLFFFPEHINNLGRVAGYIKKNRRKIIVFLIFLVFFLLTFKNDHVWNQTDYLLRNRPLNFFNANISGKLIYFAAISYTSLSLYFFHFREKICFLLYPILFLTVVTFNLVEPRYYMVFYAFFILLKKSPSLILYMSTFLFWILFDLWMMTGTINFAFYP